MNEEFMIASSAFFITLTYREETIPKTLKGSDTLRKSDLQDYMKNLRHHTTNKLRYFAVGEYGTNSLRPHYHMMLFNFPSEERHKIITTWDKGFTVIGQCEPKSMHYVTKYLVKDSKLMPECQLPFILVSKGFGYNYLNNNAYMHWSTQTNEVTLNGHKQRLPRYYAEKIFSKYDKENLTIKTKKETLKKEIIKEKTLIKKGSYPPKIKYERTHQKLIKMAKNLKKDVL